MARQYAIACPAASLSAATAKTLIEVNAVVDFAVCEFDVTFNGTTSSATPVLVELIRYTTTGTGTGATVIKYGHNASVASSATGKTNLTVEGTGSIEVIRAFYVPPTAGMVMQFPLGREITMAGGAIAGTTKAFFGLRTTAPATVSAVANLVFEE